MVEIRNFGQGSEEIVIAYPHPDLRLVKGEPSSMSRDAQGS
jgi:hypothetical protein